jgi:hypothetical protein
MKALNILVLIFLVSYSLYAQSMKENASLDIHVKKDFLVNPQRNEIELVVGKGYLLNYNLVNIPGEISGGEFNSIRISYARYLFNSYSSIGICMDICNGTDLNIQSTQKVTANFFFFGNLGLVYKREFPEIIIGDLMPYLAAGLYYSGNYFTTDINTEGEAEGGSVSFTVGLTWLGMSRSMQRNWLEFAVEMKTFYGITKWSTKPFEESSGLTINPFFIELNLLILFRF